MIGRARAGTSGAVRTVCGMLAAWALCGAALAAGAPPPSASSVEAAADAAWRQVSAHAAIPGAVVSVVGPDGFVFTKGYGVRDIRTRAPVDPERTLFQVGSVTKLFTAVLALQAVDAGRLNLDEDLRGRFSGLQIHDALPDPVTVRQLLAHRAGFDGDLSGVMTARREDAERLDPARMMRHLRRVRSPGVIPAYDNTGVGLLGEVAARSRGLSYRDAMRRFVLEPLGMARSSIGLPADREADAAACHRIEADGRITICAHTFMRPGFEGAGALATTGADMTKFMAMLLNGGRGANGPVLSSAAFADYVNLDQNRFAPGVPGMGALIEQTTLAGRAALFHTGGYDGFSSGLYVLPQQRWAIFVSVEEYAGLPRNQDFGFIFDQVKRAKVLAKSNGYKAVEDIAAAIAALTPPSAAAAAPKPSGPALPPARVAGFYTAARTQSPSFFDTLIVGPLFGATVKAAGPHAITLNGQALDWLGGGTYRARASGHIAAFKTTPQGLAFSPDSSGAYVKVSAWRSPLSAALFVLSLILFLIVAAVAALATGKGAGKGLGLRFLGVAAVACLCVGLELQAYPALWYGGASVLPIVAWRLLLDAALICGLVLVWRSAAVLRRSDPRVGWGRASVLVLVCLAFVGFLVESAGWGLIGRLTG